MTRDELTAKLKANPRFVERSTGQGFTVAAAEPPKAPEPPPSPEEQALLDEYERYKGRKLSQEELWLALVQARATGQI